MILSFLSGSHVGNSFYCIILYFVIGGPFSRYICMF